MKNITIANEKLINRLLLSQFDVENFIFSLNYLRQKVELNISLKMFVFITIRHRTFHLYAQLSFTKMSYLRGNTHLRKDAAFSFSSSENMIFP